MQFDKLIYVDDSTSLCSATNSGLHIIDSGDFSIINEGLIEYSCRWCGIIYYLWELKPLISDEQYEYLSKVIYGNC